MILTACLLPVFTNNPALRETLFTILLSIAMASSLNIILGYTGYISFGHIVFFGLGGYVGLYLLSTAGLSLWIAIPAGGAAAALLAFLLGKAILRLRGAYFALATIGVNEAMRALVINLPRLGGSTGIALHFSVYEAYGGATTALWLAYGMMILLTLAIILLSYRIKTSKFGLGLMAIREDEDAAGVMGIDTTSSKTWAYVLSAIVPGMVGVVYYFKNSSIEPGDAFNLSASIEYLVMVMLGGSGTVVGPVLGAAGYEILRGFLLLSRLFKNIQLTVAGLLLLLVILFIPAGALGWLRRRFPTSEEDPRMTILNLTGVSKWFGGLRALTEINIDLPEGQVLGLIGPNGAGKTTLFNVINGIYSPEEGRVTFRGRDITGENPFHLARMGMARTHQIVRPLNELTVRENVMAGACFGREYKSLSEAGKIADEVMKFVGLDKHSGQLASSLNIAEKKRLELARTLSARPFLLLLDEVLAGLNPSEIAIMVEAILGVRDQGVSIIMIEHVMQAIIHVSDRIMVLNYGQQIAAGTPAEVLQDKQVIEAYLGKPEDAEKLIGSEQ